MSIDRIPIVTIAGTAHGGTTLLDLLISGHSRAVSVGEAQLRDEVFGDSCSCGAETVLSCPYWIAVNDRLRAEGKELTTLERNLRRPDYAADVASLYRAVLAVSGGTFIVDSQKSIRRLRLLRERTDLFRHKTVVLHRQPSGVAASFKRKGYPLRRAVRTYNYNFAAHLLSWKQIDALVSYEELTRDPRAVLEATMTALGLSFEPGQLDWGTRPRHDLGGNRMRRQRGGEIRHDTSWKERLTAAERLKIGLAVSPGIAAFRLTRLLHRRRAGAPSPWAEGVIGER